MKGKWERSWGGVTVVAGLVLILVWGGWGQRTQPARPRTGTLLSRDCDRLKQCSTGRHDFLSVLVMIRDEGTVIREFVLHHLQEGVDHVYIINDRSEDNFRQELSCVRSSFYTIINAVGPPRGAQRQIFNFRQALQEYGACTEYMAVIDADEFLTSRLYPDLTTAQVLRDHLNHCDSLSVPWLLYAWDGRERDPASLRKDLTWRWSFDARAKPPALQELRQAGMSEKDFNHLAGDIHQFIYAKGIFRTRQYCAFLDAHRVSFQNPAQVRTCVTLPSAPTCDRSQSGCAARDTPKQGEMMMLAHVTEEQVPRMSLALHHYRIRSWAYLASRQHLSQAAYLDGIYGPNLLSKGRALIEKYADRRDLEDPW
eukprot:CAMPEP_0119134170 /NCGR_PEP_ID=MMETSP1310-20130426/15890_1 /TAXON_ID=464262 /ORGANISM="Genus nov. species nov., Strain RCC2339" /LENGTH=367 /DNA_ID=CAMNT_0007124929 /DNA_START=55 /DNA_END=1155 /DNA_ORIENTATION=+